MQQMLRPTALAFRGRIRPAFVASHANHHRVTSTTRRNPPALLIFFKFADVEDGFAVFAPIRIMNAIAA